MKDSYLYDGEVILRFNPKSHRYEVIEAGKDPFYAVSVTTVLSVISKGDALTQWAANQVVECIERNTFDDDVYDAEAVRKLARECKFAFKGSKQRAADIGTEAHNTIDGLINTALCGSGVVELPDYASESEQVSSCVSAAVDWMRQVDVLPVLSERRIYSRRFGYSGTTDLIGYIQGKLAIIDWKSSKYLYPEYALQTAAYAKAYEEETGQVVSTRWLIRLGKEDGAFEAKECPDLEGDFEGFKAALTLYRWLQENK